MKITILGYKISLLNLAFLIGLLFASSNGYYCEIPKDILALEVINDLHIELDDNNDGVVDVGEAEGFAQEKLKYEPSSEITNIFINHITKDKLWNSWKSSEAYNWTVDDVIIWLTVHIDLPEYTNVFIANNVTGSMIPRLSTLNPAYLQNDLKILNPEHCKKIAMNSKELILFGIPKDIESKFSKDKLAFEAIKQLHAQLDDDQDGGVDPQEADEFARDELRYTTDFERAKGLNMHDNHISKEELWRNWKSSQVFNWTVSDVLEWLNQHVELPEYEDVFRYNEINGSVLPRLSLSDMSFLIKDLKIKNPVHRKKLLLKSTDLILFGAPKKHHSRMKDSILFTLTILTFGGCWIAFFQHRHSKKQLKNMQDKMNQLGRAEESLCKLQNKLKEAEIQNSRVTSEKLEIEEKLKSEIEKFKEEIIRTDSSEDLFKNKQSDDQLFNQLNLDHGFSKNLKILLQMTYEVEGHFFSIKRLAAEQQMRNVRDMCERLRKKKNTFIGSLKMAHSGNLDDMDKQLSEAKHSIDEVRSDLNERSQRWECIEKLTRFKIFPTPGLAALRSTFKTNNSGGICRQSLFSAVENSSDGLESLSDIESIQDVSIKGSEDSKPFYKVIIKGPETLPIYSADISSTDLAGKLNSAPQFVLNTDEFDKTLVPIDGKQIRHLTHYVSPMSQKNTSFSCLEVSTSSMTSLNSSNQLQDKHKSECSPRLLRNNKHSFAKLFHKKDSSASLNFK